MHIRNESVGLQLTFGSLFAGVGGFDIGMEAAGFACSWQVEWDKQAQSVLRNRWPDVPNGGTFKRSMDGCCHRLMSSRSVHHAKTFLLPVNVSAWLKVHVPICSMKQSASSRR